MEKETINKTETDVLKNHDNIITEGQENDMLDENLKKILFKLLICIGIVSIIIFIVNFSFFNIRNNLVGVTEGFFGKQIQVYTDSGIKMVNPFNFNIKTTYPLYPQSISFDSDNTKDVSNIATGSTVATGTSNVNTTIQGRGSNIYDTVYNTKGLKVNTKDEIGITVKLSISYKLKKDVDSISSVYNNTGNGNFIEKIVIPTITSSVSDVYSTYKLIDIVSKGKKEDDNTSLVSLGTILKEKVSKELGLRGFEVLNFTFGGIETSAGITKTIEELFNTQNQKELEKTKLEILSLQNTNSLKELELTNSIYTVLKKANLSIEDYQKIKMIQIFENKWNGNIIPNGLNDLINK